MGLLVLCIALPACNKHKTTTAEQEQAAAHAAMGAETPQSAPVEYVEIPPHQPQHETASAQGMPEYREGSRPAGTVPGQGTQPGTTRAVEPSQGTIRPPATTTQTEKGQGAGAAAVGQAETSPARGDIEQGTSKSDREMTQRIRRALIEDESLSFTAKNIQIITRNGNVTLRGLVLSDSERKAIDKIARDYVGGGSVVNVLELKNSPAMRPLE